MSDLLGNHIVGFPTRRLINITTNNASHIPTSAFTFRMDWFNNIGCESLESEANEYFQQYLWPSTQTSSRTEINTNSESETDEPDYDRDPFSDEQARSVAHEFCSSGTQEQASDDQPHVSDSDDVNLVRQHIENIFSSECGCQSNCFRKLSSFKDQAYDLLLTLREYSKPERDIYLLSKLENLEILTDVTRKGKRERQRFRYSFQGVEICESSWRAIYDIRRSEFKSLKKQLKENGVSARVHGLTGKKSNHGFPYEVIEGAVLFIKRYADEFGLPMPAAPRGRDSTPPILLPCSDSKSSVYDKYKESCEEAEKIHVGSTVFYEVWNSCVPHIEFIKPKTDLCKTCFELREDIAGAVNECDKIELTQKLVTHLEVSRQERDFYKTCTQNARGELGDTESPVNKYNTPCTADLENVHYTFDFSQYVTLPHSSQQVGALFFLSPRKVQIFGVCDEAKPLQTNYLIDENETIGADGSRTHGPNAVISMLDHYLLANSHGEIGCHLHADNAVGQNKNKTMLHYLTWRCAKEFHKNIQLHFMIAGHTKCLCDACFGMIKKRYRKSAVNNVAQLAEVIDMSAKCNRSERYNNLTVEEGNRLVWRRWDDFFSRYFKPVRGIGKFHHFRFLSEEPGVVYARVGLNDTEKRIPLLKDGMTITDILEATPEIIVPAGLSAERKKYLDSEIRPFVQGEFRDSFCPRPTEE